MCLKNRTRRIVLDIKQKHKVFLIVTVICSIIFILFSIFMGISSKNMSSQNAKIVFGCCVAYSALWIVITIIIYLPMKKKLAKYILEFYSFDKTKKQKLDKSKIELNGYFHTIQFSNDGLYINDKLYKYQDLNFEYSTLSSFYTVKLFITEKNNLKNGNLYVELDVDEDLFHCLNYYDLNIKDFYDCLYNLVAKYGATTLKNKN